MFLTKLAVIRVISQAWLLITDQCRGNSEAVTESLVVTHMWHTDTIGRSTLNTNLGIKDIKESILKKK